MLISHSCKLVSLQLWTNTSENEYRNSKEVNKEEYVEEEKPQCRYASYYSSSHNAISWRQ